MGINPVVLFIDSLASGFSIEAAAALADIDLKEASIIAEDNKTAIEERRKQIEDADRIILPSYRWKILNEAARMGIEGYYVADKGGFTKLTYNPAVSISAVRVANEMQSDISPVTESANISTVVREMFEEMRRDNAYSVEEAWDRINEALPDYSGIIGQIRRSYDRNR